MLFRGSETGEGNFYFTGKSACRLYQLLVSLSMKARPGIPSPKSLDVQPVYDYMDESDEMSARSSKTIGGRSGRSKLVQIKIMCVSYVPTGEYEIIYIVCLKLTGYF